MNQKHCRGCPHLDLNEMSDEMYCKLKDYEPIWLRWHKQRPDWCPLVKQKGGKMTNKDIFDIFQMRYPEMKTIDYRPFSNLFRPTGYGITIWTDRGDVILYFPKEGERRTNERTD